MASLKSSFKISLHGKVHVYNFCGVYTVYVVLLRVCIFKLLLNLRVYDVLVELHWYLVHMYVYSVIDVYHDLLTFTVLVKRKLNSKHFCLFWSVYCFVLASFISFMLARKRQFWNESLSRSAYGILFIAITCTSITVEKKQW